MKIDTSHILASFAAIGLLSISLFAFAGMSREATFRIEKADHGTLVLRSVREGLLEISGLGDRAIRVRRTPNASFSDKIDFVFSSPLTNTCGKITDEKFAYCLTLPHARVRIAKSDGRVTVEDVTTGQIVFREKDATFTASPSRDADATSYQTELHVDDQNQIFGFGEFQDGYLDVSRLPRDLIQVNTQASVPMYYSRAGYGLYWHNYSRTRVNPTTVEIPLHGSGEGKSTTVDVSTGAGGAKEVRKENLWGGVFTLEGTEPIPCAFELDCGKTQGRKLILEIDGQRVLHQENTWLPPRMSVRDVMLAPGEHTARVIVNKGDTPRLGMRPGANLPLVLLAEDTKEMDYFVFVGSADEVTQSFRALSGAVPLLPRYAYGYWHCRERFHNQDELLENLKEFRAREMPIDVIVQDWQWWEQGKWNSMSFDPKNYPNPKKMNDEVHNLHARTMLSVWSKVDTRCDFGTLLTKTNAYIKGTTWLDFTNPLAGETYWTRLKENIVSTGIDSWWFDATEPENDDLRNRQLFIGRGNEYRNIYPLCVNRLTSSKLRAEQPDRRALLLTRCAFAGQQACPSVVWSGDIGSDWDSFRRQIACGLGMSIAGIPYWTTDTGGFFRPRDQYTSEKYHERLIRWFQFSVFCPILRVHGFVSNTEPWRYGEKVERHILSYLHLRYRLLPYVYSLASDVSLNGGTMMRPLVMDFPSDEKACSQIDEYMFGPTFLVAPMTSSAPSREVYLPKGVTWVDYWTGTSYPGGQTICANVPLEKIPLYLRAGSVIPWCKPMQQTDEYDSSDLEIHVIPGADGSFVLYDDNGRDYQYEKGAYSRTRFTWDNAASRLTIEPLDGETDANRPARTFRILLAFANKGYKNITYNNTKTVVDL